MAVLPVLGMNFPAGHVMHWESSSAPLYLPTGQISQVPPAAAWPEPTAQVKSEVQPVLSVLAHVPPVQEAQEVSPEVEV